MTNLLNRLEQELFDEGVLRVGELAERGYPKTYLGELARRGKAIRQTRGLYRHPNADIPVHFSLSLACTKVPKGIICLLSALAWHGIGTQAPHEVWIAIHPKARVPKLEYPQLRVVRFSGRALTEGVAHLSHPFPMRITTPAKTIADCFKYRNKIGVDIAIEALKEGWKNRRFSIDELTHCARICRVENIIKPYLESIL